LGDAHYRFKRRRGIPKAGRKYNRAKCVIIIYARIKLYRRWSAKSPRSNDLSKIGSTTRRDARRFCKYRKCPGTGRRTEFLSTSAENYEYREDDTLPRNRFRSNKILSRR